MAAAVVITALVFNFTNGFHHTANAMATSIATGALAPKVAVAISAVLKRRHRRFDACQVGQCAIPQTRVDRQAALAHTKIGPADNQHSVASPSGRRADGLPPAGTKVIRRPLRTSAVARRRRAASEGPYPRSRWPSHRSRASL